jgi:hypothetical protein
MKHTQSAAEAATHQYSRAELAQFRDDLREIQRAARRKRLFGKPDVILEIAAETVSERLRRMEWEARG